MIFRIKGLIFSQLTTFIVAIVLSILVGHGIVKAQIPAGDLDISSSTGIPSPGQNMTLTVRSYSTNINAASITWSINGKVQKKGTGLTTFEVTAPAIGQRLTVGISVRATDGKVILGTYNVQPGDVDMIVETDGYVPPFFLGKLEPVYQNGIKIIAIPHVVQNNKELDPKSLIYKWKRNGSVIDGQSGFGKQSINLTGDIVPRAFSITVEISSVNGPTQAEGEVSIDFTDPKISFYTEDALYGTMFNRSIISNVRIGSEKEAGVRAVPYGFNKGSSEGGGLTMSWFINGQSRPDLSKNENVVLRAPAAGEGSSSIRLAIKSVRNFLQGTESEFAVIFTTPKVQNDSTVNFQ